MRLLGGELERRKRPPGDFPHALVTMWTWITDKRADAERILSGAVGPLVNRDPAQLRRQICVGSAQECAELLSRYARAGCQRVHFWPVGDERRQIELIAGEVMPRVRSLAHWSLTATSFRRVHRRGQGAGASISAAWAAAGRRGPCCVPDRRGLGLPRCGMMKIRDAVQRAAGTDAVQQAARTDAV